MAEIEDQLKAWADAAAPTDDGNAVRVTDLAPTPAAAGGAGGARRWLAVAAAVAVLAVGAGALAWVVGGDDRDAVGTGDTTTSTTEPDPQTDPALGDVDFQLLHLGGAGEAQMGTVRVAATDEQLAALWDDLVDLPVSPDAITPYGPRSDDLAAGPPSIDFDEQVVVAITIPDDACAPALARFDLDGSAVTPVFEEVAEVCEQPLIPKRYVVALDRTGIDRLRLPADDVFDLPATEVLLRPGRTGEVVVDVELPGLTSQVPAGQPLPATVVVSNNTGAPIPGTICGDPFWVGLRNPGYEQGHIVAACAVGFDLPPGVSSYPLEIATTVTSCTTNPSQVLGVEVCGPGGALPALEPGEYSTFVEGPAGIDLDDAELPITVTAP